MQTLCAIMRHARTVLMRAAAAPGLTGALAPSRLLSIHAAMLAVYAGTIPFYLKEDGIGFGRNELLWLRDDIPVR